MAISESRRSVSVAPKLGPLTIAVLAGGESSERTISLASGAAVSRGLAERGYTILEVDPGEVDLTQVDWTGIDVAFLALHGRMGEDGQVQFILESLQVPYTGSDPAASRLGFSKSASKERFFQHSVPTPHYVLIHESDTPEHILNQARGVGFPLVVKPDTQGSSLGVSIIASPAELPGALAKCFELDSFGILEVAIRGAEWTVGLLDELTLPPIQIVTNRQFFDYAAKYEDDGTGYRFDSKIPAEVLWDIERVARAASEAIGTRGLSRVDIMLDESQQPWVLEVNTIPGMTDHSLVPKAAARIGLSLGELCERTIASCLKLSGKQRK